MTSKQRSKLMSLAQTIQPVISIGKSALTPELTEAVNEVFNTRELIKISILQNCLEDKMELAQTLADRTHSQLVQVIGKKIVLYRQAKDPKDRKIEL